MNQPHTTLWRATRKFEFHAWVDGAVLYDLDSGDTHSLTLPALEILQLIRHTPCTLQDLAVRLLPSDAPSAEDHVTIEAIVLNLNALGLIEPAPL